MKGLLLKLTFVWLMSIGVSQISMAQFGVNLVTLNGVVRDVNLQKPITAKLTLESLPYGSDNRVFYSDEHSGDFSFKVEENSRYKVSVSAEGYITEHQIIEVTKGMKLLEYELISSGSGSIVRLDINFAQSKAKISAESFEEINKLALMLKENPTMEIQLEGHTDCRGSASANMRLSEERVAAVQEYLISKDIDENRLKTKAFGGSQPLSRENTDSAKLINRRVEARILKTQ